MKHLCLLFFFLGLLSSVQGQNSDSIENCIIKYKQFNFLSRNIPIKPLTLFLQSNGNFYLRNGHVEQPTKELVRHRVFNKKGKQIKQYRELYENSIDSSVNIVVENYLSEKYYNSKSNYLETYIERFSVILHEFDEPLMNDSSDNNMFRVAFLCHSYMGNDKHYQQYNLIRVHLDSNVLVYKTGHYDTVLSFVIDFEGVYHLKQKEIKRINKRYDRFAFTDENIYYQNNFCEQRLFEFNKKGDYHMYLRANLYEDKIDDLSYFNGLFNLLYFIVKDNVYGPIENCQ